MGRWDLDSLAPHIYVCGLAIDSKSYNRSRLAKRKSGQEGNVASITNKEGVFLGPRLSSMSHIDMGQHDFVLEAGVVNIKFVESLYPC